MKKTIIIVLAFMVTGLHESLAQTMRLGIYTGLNLYPSTGPGRMMTGKTGSSFDQFAENYNTANASNLSSPLTHFKMKPSLHAGTNFMWGVFYSEIAYNTIHGRAKAELHNGNKRVMDMKLKDLDVALGFGYGGTSFYAYFVGVMNFGMGDKLRAWTEYPDGTESFGTENYLNGVYTDHARIGFRPGLRFGFSPSDEITLMISLDKLKEGGAYNYWTDDDVDSFSSVDNETIPVDWQAYINDPGNYILTNPEVVHSGWSGLQLRLGICFNMMSEDL